MKLIVEKCLKGEQAVKSHPNFGKAVFIECGFHDPENFCYDHHSMEGEVDKLLSPGSMIATEMIQRRRLPTTVICNHIRHLDNLMAMYILQNRSLAGHPDTTILLACADLMDRVGPLAASSLPQLQRSVLETAQAAIPFKEFELSDEELKAKALEALEILRNMVTKPRTVAEYETLAESEDQHFIIVRSESFLGSTLYDAGYDAYVAVAKEGDKLRVTAARASEYVPFDIPALIARLNELEPGEGSWGGRPTIAGSPKPDGSGLELDVIVQEASAKYAGL